MKSRVRQFAVLAAASAGLLPGAAQAQYYGASYAQPSPLYPYTVQRDQSYAVEVAPNTYVIQRPAKARRRASQPVSGLDAAAGDRLRKSADRGLIEELHNRSAARGAVINTTRVVRDPPVVVETKRVVDDPPRVIVRRRIVEDAPVRSRRPKAVADDSNAKREAGNETKQRVIRADAEVTILGPDRMSIRLFRKGHNAKADAKDD